MRKYKDVRKRIIAVVLALLTVITTWSADLTAYAATYSNPGTQGGSNIYTGGKLAEVYTANGAQYEKLNTAAFQLDFVKDATVSCDVAVYQNLTDTSDPESGALSYEAQGIKSVTGTAGTSQTVTVDLAAAGANVYLANGETYSVVLTLTTSVASGEVYYSEGTTGNAGFRKIYGTDSGWSNCQNVIQTTTTENINASTVTDLTNIAIKRPTGAQYNGSTTFVSLLSNADGLTVTADLAPAYKRDVTFTSNDLSVATVEKKGAYNEGTIIPQGAGVAQITATAAGSISSVFTVAVLDASIPESSYVYTGSDIKPTVTVNGGSEPVTFTTTYSNNKNVGTATASIKGTGNYAGYQESIDYKISSKVLTQDMVDAGTYGINSSSWDVTSASIAGLTYNTDYTATAIRTESTSSSITYEVTVTGIGNYSGEFATTKTINASVDSVIDINDLATASLDKSSFVYDGEPKKPEFVFKDDDGAILSDINTHCDISYSNNINASSSAMVTITGREDEGYTGSITKKFKIAKCDLANSSDVSVTGIKSIYERTGSAITPTPVVRLKTATGSNILLDSKNDYSVSYANNTNIGNATVTISGDDNFTGSIDVGFEIIGIFDQDSIVEIGGVTTDYSEKYKSSYSETYAKEAVEPDVYVKIKNKSLNVGTDYTVSYQDNDKAGTATAVITGAGKYEGKTINVTYTITPITITKSLIVKAGSDKVYNGSAIELDPSEYSIPGLTEGDDYEITYTNNTDAGTATITATGINNYTGTKKATFTISPRVITDNDDVTVSTIAQQTYTGSALKPTIHMYYLSEEISSSNYDVTYNDNTNIGTATATITAKNNFTGSRVVTFTIKAKTLEDLTYTVAGCSVSKNALGKMESTYSVPYTGAAQEPTVVIKDGVSTLNPIRDYTTGYSSQYNVGTATIYVYGNGNYKGSGTQITFNIVEKDIASNDIEIVDTDSNYKDGDYTLPTLKITDAGAFATKQSLKLGVDYEVIGTESSKTSGDGKIATIRGIGNYTGETTIEYSIGKDISKVGVSKLSVKNPYDNSVLYSVQEDGNYYIPYLGDVTPNIALSLLSDGTALQQGRDYTVEFETMVTANQGSDDWKYTAKNNNKIKATITGIGDYYGTVEVTYYILRVTLKSDSRFSITNKQNSGSFTYIYDGTTKQVDLDINYKVSNRDTLSLVQGEDFDVTYNSDVAEVVGPDKGSIELTITGKGNYEGDIYQTYVIDPVDISDVSRFTAAGIGAQEFTGSPIKPDFSFTDNAISKFMTTKDDIDVSYSNNINIGEASINLTGKGNYTGTRTLSFSIVARSLADSNKVEISDIPDQVYTGSALTPALTVYYGSTPLVQGTDDDPKDYTCTYTQNVELGQAKVTIKGTGIYAGTTTAYFNIIGDLRDTSLFTFDGMQSSYNLVSGALAFNSDTVTIKYNEDKAYVKPENYEISFVNCTTPGVGQIVYVGKNYCKGARTFNVKVIGNLNEAEMIGVNDAYNYTGSQITPTPQITYNSNVLQLGRDYTITYGENKLASANGAFVTAQFVTDSYYTGSLTKYFSVQYNLDEAVVDYDTTPLSYTGTDRNPVVNSVTVNGKVLSSTSDYKVVYTNNINAGSAQFTILPRDPESKIVTGSKTINYKIDGVSLMSASVSVDGFTGGLPAKEYTGDAITPTVKVTYLGNELTVGTDYLLEISNNINVGNASIRVIGTGNYSGAVDKSFEITRKDIASGVTATVLDAGYAGPAQGVTPQMTLTYNGRTLVAGQDYTYTLGNNTSVTDNATVTFAGINNFTGTLQKTFKITQTDISKGAVTIEQTTSEYTGVAANPNIVVTCPLGDGDFYTLVKDSDYTVTYGTELSNMINVGSYNIKVTGKGNFINSLNAAYTITPKSVNPEDRVGFAGENVKVVVDDASYTGAAVTPDYKVIDVIDGHEVELTLGTDYTATFSNNINAASKDDETAAPTLTITGKGNYDRTVEAHFNIGTALSTAQLTLAQDTYTYDGTAKKPNLNATLDGNLLVKDVDYTIEYEEDCTNAGTKTVAIKGIGEYYGTATKTYVIEQKIANPEKIKVVLNLPKDEDGNYIVTYSGKPQTPEVIVYDEEISAIVSVRTEDYTVEYLNNNVVWDGDNPAHAVVHLTGNYALGADSYSVPFIILQREINQDFSVKLNQNRFEYTGEEIVPVVTVTTTDDEGDEIELVKDRDYALEFTDNTNAGTASVLVTGINNFVGEASTSFEIYASLKNAEVIIPDQFYTGDVINPPITVNCGGNKLVDGVDYSVAYYSDDNYQTGGYVIVTPLVSCYSDSVTKNFDIVFDQSLLVVRNFANEYTYTGKAIEPQFIISTPSGTYLPYNPIDVVYENANGGDNHTDVGAVTATIPLTAGDQTIEVTATYDIIPRNINTCTIKQLIKNNYTGEVITPRPIVLLNGRELVYDEEITVEYSNNVNPGVANAKVTGIGNFTGVSNLHYNIISADMVNLKATKATASTITLSWTKNRYVTGYQIYSGDNQTLYGTVNSNTFTVSGLQAAKDYKFNVRSYTTVNGVTTFGEIKSITAMTEVGSTSITVKSASRGRATINWSAVSDVNGYEIYRSTSATGTFEKVAVMPRTAGGYTDSNLTSGKTYYYMVRAYKNVDDGFKYGAYSAAQPVTVK